MKKSFTLAELASLTQSRLVGDPHHQITDVADLESATSSDASFLANPRYEKAMQQSEAGVVFIAPSTPLIPKRHFLVNENPSQAFQKTVEAFHGSKPVLSGFTEIHPTAVVHPTAKIAVGVTIGPHAVIDKGVSIGENTFIGSGCYIGPDSTVGKDCILHPRVVIRERCSVGNRVIIQPGAVIGSCGFGYLTQKDGKHSKLNQVGTVTIEDDVEIGANTTIDRARFKTTRIGRGSKIDNLVQIAHGVVVGEDNLLAAQTGVAGSTTTGRSVIAGGQVAIAGHITLGDGVILAGRAAVSKSLTHPGPYNGVPAVPLQEYNRTHAFLRHLVRKKLKKS